MLPAFEEKDVQAVPNAKNSVKTRPTSKPIRNCMFAYEDRTQTWNDCLLIRELTGRGKAGGAVLCKIHIFSVANIRGV